MNRAHTLNTTFHRSRENRRHRPSLMPGKHTQVPGARFLAELVDRHARPFARVIWPGAEHLQRGQSVAESARIARIVVDPLQTVAQPFDLHIGAQNLARQLDGRILRCGAVGESGAEHRLALGVAQQFRHCAATFGLIGHRSHHRFVVELAARPLRSCRIGRIECGTADR